ncbi:MAG: fimbrillin family protein [Bacteroidales bacterium]|nr:fimbrillin family protein [Bacteroidales bacterium]
MKRYIFIVAAIVLATVSCSRTYDLGNGKNGQAIGFGSWTENLAKARTQGSSTFVSGDDFAVYGFTTKTGDVKTTVFDDIVVSYDGTDWTYSPARFWDPSTLQYTFYAVSPAAIGTAATVTPQTGEVASASITFGGADNDILVADKKEVLKANYGATVDLQFNHIASLVDLKVKKHADLGNATVAITSIGLSNIDNVGTFAVSNAYTDNHPVTTWTATASTGAYTNTSGVVKVTTLPTNVGTSGDLIINNLVAMPQAFRPNTDSSENIQQVTIAYTITDEAGNVSTYTPDAFNLALFDAVDDTDNDDTKVGGWEPGKHYTFYITINSNKIVFTGAITDWTTADPGYYYLLN